MSANSIKQSALAILAEIHTVNKLMRGLTLEYLCKQMGVKDFAIFNLIRKVWEQNIAEANTLQRQLFQYANTHPATEVMLDIAKDIEDLLDHIKARSNIMTVFLKRLKERRVHEIKEKKHKQIIRGNRYAALTE